MKKFILTDVFVKNNDGQKLYRVKALTSFGCVTAGELGGYVAKEGNLSQEGNAWVYGNAQVSGNAVLQKLMHLLQIGFIGSRDAVTTFFRAKVDNSFEIHVACGCFYGSIDKFEEAVKETHAGSKHEKTYLLAIELAKTQIELDGVEDESEGN